MGLNADPGCLLALIARLKGLLSKFLPPIMASIHRIAHPKRPGHIQGAGSFIFWFSSCFQGLKARLPRMFRRRLQIKIQCCINGQPSLYRVLRPYGCFKKIFNIIHKVWRFDQIIVLFNGVILFLFCLSKGCFRYNTGIFSSVLRRYFSVLSQDLCQSGGNIVTVIGKGCDQGALGKG